MDKTRFEIRRGERGYPTQLEDLEDPPEVLRGYGDPTAMEGPCIAVIGARLATPYGIAVAEMAGRVAAECGIVVVSGGALGCDSAALRAAQKAGGRVVVVPGSGADVVYPRESLDVFEKAAFGGSCVVSIERWGMTPTRYTFPKRNRIIAALSQCLMVAEAGERSGTTSTADCAAELGRTIYAVPGSIFSPESVGANRLISNGAAVICSEEDLEVRISLDFGVVRLMSQGQPRRHNGLLAALVSSPMRPDDLANRLGEDPLDILYTLADYELRGVVERLPDGRYAPTRETYLMHDTIEG